MGLKKVELFFTFFLYIEKKVVYSIWLYIMIFLVWFLGFFYFKNLKTKLIELIFFNLLTEIIQ